MARYAAPVGSPGRHAAQPWSEKLPLVGAFANQGPTRSSQAFPRTSQALLHALFMLFPPVCGGKPLFGRRSMFHFHIYKSVRVYGQLVVLRKVMFTRWALHLWHQPACFGPLSPSASGRFLHGSSIESNRLSVPEHSH